MFFLQRAHEEKGISLKICSLFSWINSKILEWYFQKEFKKLKEIEVWWIKIDVDKISENWYFNVEKLWKRLNIDDEVPLEGKKIFEMKFLQFILIQIYELND
jgi:hypothetical protein